jgi:hypothetical protein
MYLNLISYENRDETMSSSVNVVEKLPIVTTKLSHESIKEKNTIIHFSSLVFLISTDNNWLITTLNSFRFYFTELPALILRR